MLVTVVAVVSAVTDVVIMGPITITMQMQFALKIVPWGLCK